MATKTGSRSRQAERQSRDSEGRFTDSAFSWGRGPTGAIAASRGPDLTGQGPANSLHQPVGHRISRRIAPRTEAGTLSRDPAGRSV